MPAVSRLGLYGGSRGLYGSFAGKTEGEVPVVDETAPTGGWAALNWYDSYMQQNARKRVKREQIREEIEQLEDDTDKAIAEILQGDIEKESREAELTSLEQMVSSTFTREQLRRAKEYNERVAIAYERVARQQNYSAIVALERELERAREEEEFLFFALLLLD